MRLRDLLDETSVKIGLESADKEECMEEMVDILVRSGRLTDRAGALQALTRTLRREVNPTLYTPAEYEERLSDANSFISRVHRGARLDLIGGAS